MLKLHHFQLTDNPVPRLPDSSSLSSPSNGVVDGTDEGIEKEGAGIFWTGGKIKVELTFIMLMLLLADLTGTIDDNDEVWCIGSVGNFLGPLP